MIPRTLKVAHCVAAAAEAFAVSPADIRSTRTGKTATRPRFAAIGLACEMTEASYAVIGRAVGARDHTSIMNARDRCAELRVTDRDFALAYEAARTALTILERAGLAHLLDTIDAVAVARRIEAQPTRYAAMATAHEITAMAQWIVDMAGPDDAPTPAFPATTSADPTTETDHAA
jgi:chromosomal replication initiator protein